MTATVALELHREMMLNEPGRFMYAVNKVNAGRCSIIFTNDDVTWLSLTHGLGQQMLSDWMTHLAAQKPLDRRRCTVIGVIHQPEAWTHVAPQYVVLTVITETSWSQAYLDRATMELVDHCELDPQTMPTSTLFLALELAMFINPSEED